MAFKGDMLAAFGDITVSLAKGCKLQPGLRMWWALTWEPLPLLWAKYPIQVGHKLTAGPRPDP